MAWIHVMASARGLNFSFGARSNSAMVCQGECMHSETNNGNLERRVARLESIVENVLPTLATKIDLAALSSRLEGKIHQLHMDMQRMHVELQKMQRWLIGILITLFLGLFGIVFTIVNYMRAPSPHIPTAVSIAVPAHASVVSCSAHRPLQCKIAALNQPERLDAC
jgi:hypothetical protein